MKTATEIMQGKKEHGFWNTKKLDSCTRKDLYLIIWLLSGILHGLFSYINKRFGDPPAESSIKPYLMRNNPLKLLEELDDNLSEAIQKEHLYYDKLGK